MRQPIGILTVILYTSAAGRSAQFCDEQIHRPLQWDNLQQGHEGWLQNSWVPNHSLWVREYQGMHPRYSSIHRSDSSLLTCADSVRADPWSSATNTHDLAIGTEATVRCGRLASGHLTAVVVVPAHHRTKCALHPAAVGGDHLPIVGWSSLLSSSAVSEL